MKVLTVFANPNPKSFCHAILRQFIKGLKAAGHTLQHWQRVARWARGEARESFGKLAQYEKPK